jgi:hypothetical protein
MVAVIEGRLINLASIKLYGVSRPFGREGVHSYKDAGKTFRFLIL